jgi:glycosyltransferase involved in cell wall biosynthesis
LKHLHFTQSLEPLQGGGLGSSTAALHRQMRLSGLSSVLCTTRGGRPQCPVGDAFEFPRIKPDAFYFSPALQQQAPELVGDADVLHGHGLYVGTNFVFGREARRQSKPLVYHTHGFFEPWILNRSVWKKKLVHWTFENANFKSVRLWRALTAKEAGQIRAQGIKAPIVIIPNGLNLQDYPRPAEPLPVIASPLIAKLTKTGLRLLFLGRIHPKKGLDLLLRAWAALRPDRKDWQLVIAGPDENSYLQEISDLVRNLELMEEVCFTGPVTGSIKNELLHSADLFVLPSYSEGFPMSLLEAMACGVPVMATRACNFPDITASGAGWECDAELSSLTKTLRQALCAGEIERQERGQKGCQLVEREYAWPALVARLVEACHAHC